jgi:hypothetical protein
VVAPLGTARVPGAGREAVRVGVRVAGIIVAYFALPFERNWLVTGLLVILVLVGLFPFALRRFGRVLQSDHPVLDAVSALVITLLTLVVSFATTYHVMASRNPESLTGVATKLDALYFETTILSTVGFGDMVAVSQVARAIVTVNMVMNMVFLGTTLRLLTWTVQQRQAG